METKFALDYEPLALRAGFGGLALELAGQREIDSRASFNHFCRTACTAWSAHFGPEGVGRTSVKFNRLLDRIREGGPAIIATTWGGVVIERHEHPEVDKYLVIRRGRYLALEKHELKDEHLEVQEGTGLLLWRRPGEQALSVEAIQPGDRFHLQPGMEHCLIGTEDLLVYETSVDPKGMDQDLIFLYEPDAVA